MSETDEIEERIRELKYLGTQYAMNGLEMPQALAEEYARLLEQRGDAPPAEPG